MIAGALILTIGQNKTQKYILQMNKNFLKNHQQRWVEFLSLTSKTDSVQLSNNYCKVTDTKAHAFPKAFWDHSLSPKTLGNAVDICWDKEGESGLGQGFRL